MLCIIKSFFPSLPHIIIERISVIFCRYPIYGGMQDWNYIHGGCFELTLEISDIKWPQADEVCSLSLSLSLALSVCLISRFLAVSIFRHHWGTIFLSSISLIPPIPKWSFFQNLLFPMFFRLSYSEKTSGFLHY